MKIVKTASGKKTVKMSKSEWQSIGKTAGWMRKAEDDGIKDYESKVGFDDYKTETDSEWGAHVGDVGEMIGGEDKNPINKTLGNIPNYYLLYGGPGTGKSVWASALGNLLNIPVKMVNLGGGSKWVGKADSKVEQVMQSILSSKDTVYLLDEIDRQIGSSPDEGGHEVGSGVVGKLLGMLEDNRAKMKENSVYVVMTANNIGDIDPALVSRMQGNTFEVGGENKREPSTY